MEKINIMINGLPGNVAKIVAKASLKDERFNLIPFSLTGQDIKEDNIQIDNLNLSLLKPNVRDSKIKTIKSMFDTIIAIDFTHPDSINSNSLFYIKNKIPFVMGTTGGDRKKLKQDIKNSKVLSVVAPNMAKQIVGFQAMLEYAADNFPDLFKGYSLEIIESHQKGKADTSGTAKAMAGYFNKLGVDFSIEDIKKIRNPKIQSNVLKVPKEHLKGHGWHTYTLRSEDGTAFFEFKHNINGRDIYSNGTFDAVLFLIKKLKEPLPSKTFFTMADVLLDN